MTAHEFIPEIPELEPEFQATYEVKQAGVRYAAVCGDDREQTPESQEALKAAGIEQGDAQYRYFGGAAGYERNLSVTLIAMGMAEEAAKLGATPAEAIKRVKRDVEAANNVILELHSAAANEGNQAQFDVASTQPVGCAYGGSEAAVADLSANDKGLHELAIKEQKQLFGDASLLDQVRDANRQYKAMRFGGGEPGLSRDDYQAIGAPVQILEGQHAPADQTFVVINFTPDRISNPAKAHALGKPFYNNDVTQVAEMLMRAYPQYHLDPAILLATMDQDIRATREALAHGAPEGAAALEVRRLGSPAEALEYLNNLQVA